MNSSTHITLGTLPEPKQPKPVNPDGLQVGDKVRRRSGKKTIGTIEYIYAGKRAGVRWHGANRTRLGATSADKLGYILLSGLRRAE